MFVRRKVILILIMCLLLVSPSALLLPGSRAGGPSSLTKLSPNLLSSTQKVSRVIVETQGSPQVLDGKMSVAFTLGSAGNFLAFGAVPRSGLTSLASLPQVEKIFPDVAIGYNDTRLDTSGAGPGLIQSDLFRIRQLIGVNAVNSTLHFQGDGVNVAIVDTGTDFANPNMATSYARDANGVPIAIDPDGAGIVLTNTTVHSFTNSSGVFLNLLRGSSGTRVHIYLGASGYPTVVAPIIWNLTDYKIGTGPSNQIVSMSGNYHFGIAFESTPQGFYFFPTLVVDSNTSGVYDTVYVDFNSSPAVSELLVPQFLPQAGSPDWSFFDDAPHHIGDGSEVLSASLSGGVADISAGLLGARVLDVFGAITGGHSGFNFDLGAVNGSLLAPMDPLGNYYGVMYDAAGHGSQTAADVASSGSTPYNIYGNSTFYHLPGVAPHAKIIPVKALWIGDVLYGWMWTSGFDYSSATGSWTYSGDHKAAIVSNSWGISAWPLFNSGLGYDVVSLLEDALSLPGSFSQQYPGTIFVQAMGNGGPGYGTITSPASASFSIGVGASTSWHVASQFSSSGLPYYGGVSSYSGDVVGWSDRGPGLTGEVKPDVVNIGAFGFSPVSVMQARGNTSAEWAFFGGTSQATPLTAGVAAMVVEALDSQGTKVTPGLVKQILMCTAKDLGNDPFVQGAGQVNASAAVSLAVKGSSLLGGGFLVGTADTYSTLSSLLSGALGQLNGLVGQEVSLPPSPVPSESWFAGDIPPGGSASTTFTISNPTSSALSIALSSSSYKLISSKDLSESSGPGTSTYVHLPSDAGPIPPGTDLMVVRLYYPFNTWYNSTISPYYADDLTRLRLQIFNWVDKNQNGVVETGELSLVNTNYAWGNAEEARVSSPLAKFTGVPVLGIYQNPTLDSYWFGATNKTASSIPFSISVYYYQKVPWNTVSFDSNVVSTPGGSNATFKASLGVPANATAGTYEGFINMRSSTGQATQVPVSYVVPIDPAQKGAPYVFGGNSSGDGVLYSNGATYGATDFSWRYESGNWRAYQVQVNDPTVNAATVKVTWKSPMTSLNLFVMDPQGRIIGSSVPPGLYKSITRNFVGFPVPLPQASPSNDWLGVSFYGSGWGGGFAPSANAGPTSSILQFPVNETGTYTVVVHSTVYGGNSPFERFVGEVELSTIAPITSLPNVNMTAPSAPIKGTVAIPLTFAGQDITLTTYTVDAGPPFAVVGQGFSIDSTKLSDGPHILTVTATDAVGFTDSKSVEFVVLNTPPQLVIVNPVNGTTVQGNVNVGFFAGSGYVANLSATIDGRPIAASAGSYVWDSTTVSDGSHVLSVTAVDQAGNVRTVISHFNTSNQAQTSSSRDSILETAAVAALAGVLVGLLIARIRRPRPSGTNPPAPTT